MKRIRRTGNPVGRVARPGTWLKTGAAGGGSSPFPPNPGSAFYALAPDPDTGEMQGVINGVGSLDTTHADVLYGKDINGVYQAFPANFPVWQGGAATLSGGPGSAVTAYHAVAGQPMPVLMYYPAATNSIIESVDMTSWTPTGTPIVTIDQVGLDGGPNNAARIEDDDPAARESVTCSTITVANDGSAHVAVIYIRKDTNETRFPLIKLTLEGGTLVENRVRINTATGALHSLDAGVQEVVDVGLWWKLIIEVSNNTTGNTAAYIRIWPADALVLDGGAENTAVGAITVGNTEIHVARNRAAVRDNGPIFTTNAAVSVAHTQYHMDIGNIDVDQSAWYLEMMMSKFPNGDNGFTNTSSQHMPLCLRKNSGRGIYVYAQSAVLSAVAFSPASASIGAAAVGGAGGRARIGASHFIGENMSTNVGGTWYDEKAAAAYSAIDPQISIQPSNLAPEKVAFGVANMRRYDCTSFEDGKTIIDGVMAETEAGAFL